MPPRHRRKSQPKEEKLTVSTETPKNTFIVSDKFFTPTEDGERLISKSNFLYQLLKFWSKDDLLDIWIEGPARNIWAAREVAELLVKLFKCKLSDDTEKLLRPTKDNNGQRTDWRFNLAKHPILRGVH